MNSYYEDVKTRSRLAQAGRKVVNGSRSKKCTLPSDRLTQSQLNKRNGKVMSYNMKSPMSWLEFLSMPKDLQVTYLRGLNKQYQATQGMLADLFGKSRAGLHNYLKTNDMVFGQRGKQPTAEQRAAFTKWVSGDSEAAPPASECIELESAHAASPSTAQHPPKQLGVSFDIGSATEFESALNTIRALLKGSEYVGALYIQFQGKMEGVCVSSVVSDASVRLSEVSRQ